MANLPPLSLYIHIPWCVQKCPYCDFNSHALKGEVPHDDYVAHLLADLDADVSYAQGREVKTIFIGGGTPSLLSGPAMQTLLDGVRARLNWQWMLKLRWKPTPVPLRPTVLSSISVRA